MRPSRETVVAVAAATGFRQDIVEKVMNLLDLLDALAHHPFLSGRLVLKGGTALNVFLGSAAIERMEDERPEVERAIALVVTRLGYSIRRQPAGFAGGKWVLNYQSSLGGGGNLALDLNFGLRVPLWPVERLESRALGANRATDVPVLDLHELASGKLVALVARRAARDLYDVDRLLGRTDIDDARLRIGFVVYGAMNRIDWRTVSEADVGFDARELRQQLVPVLRSGEEREALAAPGGGELLVERCRAGLARVFPLTDAELAFLERLLEHGDIVPDLLTDDAPLAAAIAANPMLAWKALNVRRHKGLEAR